MTHSRRDQRKASKNEKRPSRHTTTDDRELLRRLKPVPSVASDVLRLQQQVGNHSVTRLLQTSRSTPFIQRQQNTIQRKAPELGHVVVGAAAQTPTKSVGEYGKKLIETLEKDKARNLSIQDAVKLVADKQKGLAAPTAAESGSSKLDTSKGTKRALIITNSTYQKPETNLPKTAAEGKRMQAILTARKYGVDLKTDLTAAAMGKAMTAFVNLGAAQDDLVIYYSGHGLVNGMQGTDNKTVAPSTVGGWQSTALQKGFRLTLIMEACHSGSTADFVRSQEITRIEQQSKAKGKKSAAELVKLAASMQKTKDKLAKLERAKQKLMEKPQVDALMKNNKLESEIKKHEGPILAAWKAAEPALSALAKQVQKLTKTTLTVPKGPYNQEWLNTAQLDLIDTMTNQTLELARDALTK